MWRIEKLKTAGKVIEQRTQKNLTGCKEKQESFSRRKIKYQ
jgi:hypothetical protein